LAGGRAPPGNEPQHSKLPLTARPQLKLSPAVTAWNATLSGGFTFPVAVALP